MAASKTVSVSFRVSPEFKALLEAAALTEHRSQTNMLEALLLEHCRKKGIRSGPAQSSTEGLPAVKNDYQKGSAR